MHEHWCVLYHSAYMQDLIYKLGELFALRAVRYAGVKVHKGYASIFCAPWRPDAGKVI